MKQGTATLWFMGPLFREPQTWHPTLICPVNQLPRKTERWERFRVGEGETADSARKPVARDGNGERGVSAVNRHKVLCSCALEKGFHKSDAC